MSATFWRPWEKQEQERQAQSEKQPEELRQELPQEKQHILLDPESSEEEDNVGNQAVSEDLQRAVLNCYEQMYNSKGQKHGAVLETSLALKLHRNTV